MYCAVCGKYVSMSDEDSVEKEEIAHFKAKHPDIVEFSDYLMGDSAIGKSFTKLIPMTKLSHFRKLYNEEWNEK